MNVKLRIGKTVVNVLCTYFYLLCNQIKFMFFFFFTYAPQVGGDDGWKDTFWRQMDQELRVIPEGERVIAGGDWHGHVGTE